VVSPAQVTCCGWAGDRGFFYPELNASGLHYLKPNLHGATEGYSNSRTCEIGLTMNSGISYKSIVYLVEKATR
jgi:D-lactate dehydrogenase